jgi:hypothetical protein
MEAVELALIGGDLAKLNPEQRLAYYHKVCESLGLNELTQPFAYITLNGKLQLYAKRDCTEQLRKIHNVSVTIVAREVVEDCYVVTARASTPQRQDESIGAVPIGSLKGEARANAMMKAETKAKRRVTLSICGLGLLDETEVDSIPGAQPPAAVELPPRPQPLPLPDPAPLNGAPLDTALAVFPGATVVEPITKEQHGVLEARVREFSAAWGKPVEEMRTRVKKRMAEDLGVEHFPDLTPEHYITVMGWLGERPKKKRGAA